MCACVQPKKTKQKSLAKKQRAEAFLSLIFYKRHLREESAAQKSPLSSFSLIIIINISTHQHLLYTYIFSAEQNAEKKNHFSGEEDDDDESKRKRGGRRIERTLLSLRFYNIA
jgi:hypothetical protein